MVELILFFFSKTLGIVEFRKESLRPLVLLKLTGLYLVTFDFNIGFNRIHEVGYSIKDLKFIILRGIFHMLKFIKKYQNLTKIKINTNIFK